MLRLNLAQTRGFAQAPAAPAWLFVDARSTPARVAAVLVTDGRAWYSDVEPPERFLRHFRPRGDGQITSLELLSIAFALCTFGSLLKGKHIWLFSDNSGAECGTRRGSARAWDHACLVHSIWLRAAKLGAQLWVDRVPSAENIADPPSREAYDLMSAIGAAWVAPALDEELATPSAWRSLRIS